MNNSETKNCTARQPPQVEGWSAGADAAILNMRSNLKSSVQCVQAYTAVLMYARTLLLRSLVTFFSADTKGGSIVGQLRRLNIYIYRNCKFFDEMQNRLHETVLL